MLTGRYSYKEDFKKIASHTSNNDFHILSEFIFSSFLSPVMHKSILLQFLFMQRVQGIFIVLSNLKVLNAFMHFPITILIFHPHSRLSFRLPVVECRRQNSATLCPLLGKVKGSPSMFTLPSQHAGKVKHPPSPNFGKLTCWKSEFPLGTLLSLKKVKFPREIYFP